MKFAVLLHSRDFLSGTGTEESGFTGDFRLAERCFFGTPIPRYFQPVFQPVTETVSERTRLGVFTVAAFSAFFSGFRP
ncbi:hypothetical protein [Streptomyces niveus]|uniref:hypothetical protein n=1 Tax=Streptomyces niveus TaxID=193462 RepID=UPI0036D26F62